MKTRYGFYGSIALLILVYAFGPRVDYKDLDLDVTSKLRYSLTDLDSIIELQESAIKDLKPDNHARVIWGDESKTKTKYAILYLHGFSASQAEGEPIHRNIAKEFGYNMYLSRLYDHGRYAKNSFENFEPQNYFDSAREALDIAKSLGDSIIVMSCSTGSTLSILLAAEPRISHYIMYSPNIDLEDPMSKLITKPWGSKILDVVMEGKYNHVIYDSLGNSYWNPVYHTDGIRGMRWMLDNYMTKEYFEKIEKPLLLAYYYKNEDFKDDVVSIDAMYDFFGRIKTPKSKKELIRLTGAESHVISSYIMSKEVEKLQSVTIDFLKKNLMNK